MKAYKGLNVKPDTHKELMKLKAAYYLEQDRSLSADQIINILLEKSRGRQK